MFWFSFLVKKIITVIADFVKSNTENGPFSEFKSIAFIYTRMGSPRNFDNEGVTTRLDLSS